MEGGFPMLNCLLQHTLKSLCSSSDSPSKWVYAVFWRILPRNYPPPKWDHGGGAADRFKGNKRNWILVWEDGFCDFLECERAGIKGRFGPELFFKMSHEVYCYGEGLVGKVAADNSHKWVFKENPTEHELGLLSSWNVQVDPQPRAWESQFNSGIQTIAIISVREGIIQLGSFHKIMEDFNLVISIQRKFIYLQSIPDVFAIQRPSPPFQHLKPSAQMRESSQTAFSGNRQLTGGKRLYCGKPEEPLNKSINFGWNIPQNSIIEQPIWSIPPHLPTMPGCLLSKPPSIMPSDIVLAKKKNHNHRDGTNQSVKVNGGLSKVENIADDIKVESSCLQEIVQEEKPSTSNPNLGLEDGDGSGIRVWTS